jgi:hypothetical protein
MPGLSLKLAGALFAGSLAGVAGLTTLTSASTQVVTPASDSTTSTTPTVVESSAPCPTGTVEQGDACVKTVTVPVAATEAPKEDAPEPSETPEAVVEQPQQAPAAPAAPAPQTQPQVTSHDGEHEDGQESDATEVEHEHDSTEVQNQHESDQPSGDHTEQESDD